MSSIYKMHHTTADTDRLYVKRRGGVRGLSQFEVTYTAVINNIAEYLVAKYEEDQFVNTDKRHQT